MFVGERSPVDTVLKDGESGKWPYSRGLRGSQVVT